MSKRVTIQDDEEVVKTKWFSLRLKGLICVMIIIIIIGVFSVLIFNVGYDPKAGGWYWKPNTLEVNIKKSKE